MARRWRVVGAAGVGLLVAGAACSDDEPSADERREDYVDALAGASDLDPFWSDEAVRCAAGGVVTAVGVDELEAEVGTPDDVRAEGEVAGLRELGISLTGPERDAFYDELSTCTDTAGLLRSLLEEAADLSDAAGPLTEATFGCVEDGADDEFLRDWAHALVVLGSTEEDPAFQDRQVGLYSRCIAEAQMTATP